MNSKSLTTLQEAAREDNPALSKAGFNPTSMSEAIAIANLYIASGLTAFKRSSEAVVAIEHGMSLGMSPAQSMQSIAIINGKPGIYGDAALALVKSTGMLAAHSEKFSGTIKGGDRVCTCNVRRVSKLATGDWVEFEYEQSFSVADAKDAKLWGKQGPWTQYPDRMLKMRARAFCLRDAFPDILKGVGIAEELQDIPGRKAVENIAPPEINGSRAAGLGATLAGRVSPEPEQAEESPESGDGDYIDTEAVEAAETQHAEPSDAEQPQDGDWDDSLLDELPT